MAELWKKNNGDHRKKEGQGKNKKENDNVPVVLKADLYCEGCVSKVLKCVENATIGDGQRITVVGKVDPAKLREELQKQTHKKVEIISPAPEKDDDKDEKLGKEKEGEKKKNKEIKGKNSENKSDAKKNEEKELPVTTAVLRMHLHCHGCTQKISKHITKIKGYRDMKIDEQKQLVTVTGAMDMNALAKSIKKHLKKDVEILPPKKEVEKKDGKGGEKVKAEDGDKGKAGGGEDKGKTGGGEGDGGGGGGGKKVGEKVERSRSESQVGRPDPVVNGSGVVVEQFHYNPCEFGSYHAPQIFSDENPNSCTVM